MAKKLLLPKNQYLAAGIHIGMKNVNVKMKKFIYQIRKDGLAIFDLAKTDERIKIAARFLAKKDKILVVGRKAIAKDLIEKFAKLIGAKGVSGRYLPGMLTNPNLKNFFEADALIVSDPLNDRRAMEDAVKARIPIVAICDVTNEIRDVDLIIPANNKGRKALALVFWLLAREILKERGEIKTDRDFGYKFEEFVKGS